MMFGRVVNSRMLYRPTVREVARFQIIGRRYEAMSCGHWGTRRTHESDKRTAPALPQ